ncbi:hypothetical protein BDZ97DRAFT_1878652 [Flammula alnicola]|nr:hypothetical protein BDZ97DRAFT_1878652 [Flammula alnicola]
MSFFDHSRNPVISGGKFFAAQGNVYYNSSDAESGAKGLEWLRQQVAHGAYYKSAERYYNAPECHPGTREVVLKDIMEWATNTNMPCFLWLHGSVGVGKSTIAHTVAGMLSKESKLAATFFFSPKPTISRTSTPTLSDDARRLITTLVYQLVISIPEIRDRVGQAIENDHRLLFQSLEVQIRALIVNPLNDLANEEGSVAKSRPSVIILDGLDQCGPSKDQRYVLDVLAGAVEALTVPISFLVVSRPEHSIRNFFSQKITNSSACYIDLNAAANTRSDILDDMKQNHPSCDSFPLEWPDAQDFDTLVEKSSDQFIYASTAINFICDDRYLPWERLKVVLGLRRSEDETPFGELDALYRGIFAEVADISKVRDILNILLFIQSSNSVSPSIIELFLSYHTGAVQTILCELHSVLAVPTSGADRSSPLRVLHMSLREFLLDATRAGLELFIDAKIAHTRITRLAVKQLAESKEDGRGGYRQFLCLTFMKHCCKSHPSQELIGDLYRVDLGLELEWFSSNFSSSVLVPELLIWLQGKRGMSAEKDLYQYHSRAIDHWFHTQLVHYPQSSSRFYILVAATLDFPPSFHVSPKAIFNLMTKSNHDTDEVDHLGAIDDIRLSLLSRKPEYQAYHKILALFLRDPSRAGGYLVCGSTYAVSLSTKLCKHE